MGRWVPLPAGGMALGGLTPWLPVRRASGSDCGEGALRPEKAGPQEGQDQEVVVDPKTAFSGIPDGLRAPLLAAFNEIMRNFRERRWEPSELNGGKLCEVVYSILRGHIDGKMPAKPSKPKNMYDACLAIENESKASAFPRAVRIQIPACW